MFVLVIMQAIPTQPIFLIYHCFFLLVLIYPSRWILELSFLVSVKKFYWNFKLKLHWMYRVILRKLTTLPKYSSVVRKWHASLYLLKSSAMSLVKFIPMYFIDVIAVMNKIIFKHFKIGFPWLKRKLLIFLYFSFNWPFYRTCW